LLLHTAQYTYHIRLIEDETFFPSSASEESVGHFTTHTCYTVCMIILYLGKYDNRVHI